MCEPPVGRCVSAACTADTDCSGGALCAGGVSSYGAAQLRICDSSAYSTTADNFRCQRPGDQCITFQQCTALTPGDGTLYAQHQCQEGADKTFACVLSQPAPCGRPFVINDLHRQASLVRSSAWDAGAPLSAAGANLEARTRAQIAHYYAEMGLMEHASVAAFARFSLQLMSMGAPASLVEAAQQAMGDEIDHARRSFTLAATYSGERLGPSALALEGAFGACSAREIVVNAVKEACIGETLAAIEAAEACRLARAPEPRALLEKVSRDEAHHAELGWRFLSWALNHVEPSVAREIADDVRSLLHASLMDGSQFAREDNRDEGVLADHGVLSQGFKNALRAQVMREVISPILMSILNGKRKLPLSSGVRAAEAGA